MNAAKLLIKVLIPNKLIQIFKKIRILNLKNFEFEISNNLNLNSKF
jgi:hypothetical protein